MDLPQMPKDKVKEAVSVLKESGVIVYPTETLYGLGALATDREAVKKIFKIKKRPAEKLLPVIVGSVNQTQRYFELSKLELKLARRFWPGPLSLILKTKSAKIERALGSKYVAVRFSSNRLASAIARCAGAPVISTSANISGKSGCFTLSAVKRQLAYFAAKPDLYIDGGRLKKSPPSTVIRMHGKKLGLIREGKIKLASVGKALGL